MMSDWKKILLIGLGWGIGTAVGLAVIVGAIAWYSSRPKPPKPWDTAAIKAEYDFVTTEGDDNTIVFYYTLENMTDFDYKVERGDNVVWSGKLKHRNSLTPFLDTDKAVHYPIVVPARKRVRFEIKLPGYTYIDKHKSADENAEQRRQYHAAVAKYVSEQYSNLDGFDLLDQSNRYEVIFPSGWKESKD